MSSGEMRGHIKKINDKLDKIFARLKSIDEIIEEHPPEVEASKYIMVEHSGVGWYHVVDAATGKPVWDNIFTYTEAVEKLKELYA